MSIMGRILEGLQDKGEVKSDKIDRKKINELLSSSKFGTYFTRIPIGEISKILKIRGMLLLQEDGTEFSGFFTGSKGRTTIPVGYYESGKDEGSGTVYDICDDTMLVLSWYKMESGRYEVTVYLS